MHAFLRSAHIAPKKANLIAKMIRGMPVPDAVEALRRTNKKAARIIEDLLRSAIANASHNDRQDPQGMIIKTMIVNQAQALRRGIPKARGQVRPVRKFMSHIELALGFRDVGSEEQERTQKTQRTQGMASQEKAHTVNNRQAKSKKAKDQTKSTSTSPS